MNYDTAVKKLANARRGVIALILLFVPLLYFCAWASINVSLIAIIIYVIAMIVFIAQHDRYARYTRSSASLWYYREGEKNIGPLSLDEMQPLIANGIINNDSMVWKAGSSKWKNARDALPLYFKSVPPSYTKRDQRAEAIELPQHLCTQPRKWTAPAMAGLIVATILVPIVGFVVGMTCNQGYGERKQQAKVLLILSCIMMGLIVFLMMLSNVVLY
jgi:uncharacterized membrane protein YhaH (DUF805 family)